MNNLKLGNCLKEIRKKKALTQEKISKLTNISLRTYQRYEKGENITENFLKIFSNKLSLSNKEYFDLFFLLKGDYMEDFEKIQFHLDELLEIIGYKIERYYIDEISREFVLIKNIFTKEEYHGNPDKFDYRNIVLDFLKMLVEKDLAGVAPEKNIISIIKSEEYKNILLKYEKIALPEMEKIAVYSEKIYELDREEEKEIKKLKETLTTKK